MSRIAINDIYKTFFDFVSDVKDELIVICPYIKLDALKALLSHVPKSVDITVIVRWRISDLVSGSSDLEIYKELISAGHKLRIHHDIHLKVLIKDKTSLLLGSANITNPGMGLGKKFNIEAITILDVEINELETFLKILKASVFVDEELYKRYADKVGQFIEVKNQIVVNQKRMAEEENQLIIKRRLGIVVSDFPFSESPTWLIEKILKKRPL